MSSTHAPRAGTRSRLAAVALAAGFLALTAAVLIAHTTPATGYELSIYAAIPAGFWIGAGVAFLVGVTVTWSASTTGRHRTAALALAYSATFAVVALPVIRGYHFAGRGDSLTHLGWLTEIAANQLQPVEFLYPGVHTTALFTSHVTGVGFPRALEYTVLVFAAVFLVFVPLTVRAITDSEVGTLVGAFAALALLPINNVSVHLVTHPTTQALLFVPLQLFLLVHYLVRSPPESERSLAVTPEGVLLALTSAAVVLVHPQTALNVVVVLATIAGVQYLYRRYRPHHVISQHRPVYAQAAFAALAFAVWAPRNDRVGGTLTAVVESVRSGAAPGAAVAQRGSSISEVGGSFVAFALKLFGPSAVFAALAGLVTLALLTGRLADDRPHRNAFVAYLAATLVPLTAAFALFFGLSVSTQHYRYTGFIVVLVTVLGAAGLAAGLRWLGDRHTTPALRTVAAAFFVLLVPLSLATVYASPFILQPSPQVTEMSIDGHATAFERHDPAVPFVGVRSGPERFLHVHYGTEQAETMNVPWAQSTMNSSTFNDGVGDDLATDRYVPVTRRDYLREVVLYRGFRFSADGFRSLSSTPDVNRVVTNGEFRLYYVDR
jgi:hypothetical protein